MTIISTTTRLPFSRLCTCLPFKLLLVIKYSAKSYLAHFSFYHRRRSLYVNRRGKQKRGKLCQRISRSISRNEPADPGISNTSACSSAPRYFHRAGVFSFFSLQHRIILAFHCCGRSWLVWKKEESVITNLTFSPVSDERKKNSFSFQTLPSEELSRKEKPAVFHQSHCSVHESSFIREKSM